MPSGIYKRKLEPIKIGQKFGRLTIIKEVKPDIAKNGWKIKKVLCQCKCGNRKEIVYNNLRKGNTKSCGCLKIEKTRERGKKNIKHGMGCFDFYHIWQGIKQRCNYKKHKSYKDYGGRGITICKEWLKFEEFRNDMYKSYLEHKKNNSYTSIERKNVNGNYCKLNCCWATRKEQMNNKTDNHFLTYKNKTQTMSQWANELNINITTLWYRINKNWSIEKVFNKNL